MEKFRITSIVEKTPEGEILPDDAIGEERASIPRVLKEWDTTMVEASKDQLTSIQDENEDPEGSTRKVIRIEPKPPRRKETSGGIGNILQVQLQQQRGNSSNCNSTGNIAAKYGAIGSSAGKQKIPRPANAFMLFANEWRKKLAIQNPRESNKDISVRLGVLWKNMAKTIKEKYFALAREVDAEHKRKYPGEK